MPGQYLDIERFIEGSLVTGLRALFYTDTEFKYDEDGLGKIEISASYPSEKDTLSIPQIVVADIGYSLADMSLHGNYFEDIIESGAKIGTKYIDIVPFDCRLIISSKDEGVSKDLANKAIYYMRYVGRELLTTNLNVNIKNIRKAGGGYSPIGDKKIFQSQVALSGELKMAISHKYTDMDLVKIAQKFYQTYEYTK